LQNSLNKHRNDVDNIKSNMLNTLQKKDFGDLGNGGKVLDKENSQTLNSIIQSDKPLDEKILHLQNTTKEIFKTIKNPTAEQKEMYNLVMGLKNTIGIQRKDGFDVIQTLIQKGYQSTQGGSGLDHIVFRHYGAGAVGELSSREILNIGKTIQQGTLTKEIAKDIKDKFSTYDNIRVYKRNVNPKDDVNLYVVVGEDRNKIHNVITYYSNRNIGAGDNLSKSTTGILNKSDLSSTVPVSNVTDNGNLPLRNLKSPKDMKTDELIKNNLDVIKKETKTQNHEINSPNSEKAKTESLRKKEPKNMKTDELISTTKDNIAVQRVGNVFDRIVSSLVDKGLDKLGNTKFGQYIKNSDLVNAFTGHNPREQMIKSKTKDMEDILLLHEELKFLSKTTRQNMYKYMSGDKDVSLSPVVKSFSDKYIKYIDDISEELVDLKVLSKEAANKFKGRYLHMQYTKDLNKTMFNKGSKTINKVYARGRVWEGSQKKYDEYLANGEIGDWFNGKIEAKKLKNGKYEFRQDYTKEQRQAWGEIDDIAYILPSTLARMHEMKSNAIFLKQVANDTNLIKNPKDYKHQIPDGYTHLHGKKYGALNNKYVPSDVAKDIEDFTNALFGRDGKFKEEFYAFGSFWKKGHTVWNPVGHINNFNSNVTMQFMAGINPITAVQYAKDGYFASSKIGQLRHLTAKNNTLGLNKEEQAIFKALKSDEDILLWKKAQENGLFGRSKLNDVLNNYTAPLNRNIDTSSKDGIFSQRVQSTINKGINLYKKVDNRLSKIYQGEDDIMRFSMLKALSKQGKDFNQALKIVNNTIPDYTKPMSIVAKFGRDSLLTPFISWTYYSTPIILRQIKERPSRAIALFGSLYAINKAMGINPYDNKDIPQKNFSMKRIPIYKNGNEVTTIKVDRWIPHNDILNPLDFINNLTNLGAWGGLKDVLENRNSYFNSKITSRDGLASVYDIVKYGAQQITPDIVDNIYNLGESAIFPKEKRQKNPVLLERTSTQELLKLLGLNTLTYDKEAQKKKATNEILKKEKKDVVKRNSA